jgi:hypothetical protein
MGIDAASAGAGYLAGLATGYGVYRAYRRGWLRSLRARDRSPIRPQRATSYTGALTHRLQRDHLLGAEAHLSDLLIEPRFLPMPALPDPTEDPLLLSPYAVIPTDHAFPGLYRDYNVPCLGIGDLISAGHPVAILGEPGSGRSVSLQSIALAAIGAWRPQSLWPAQPSGEVSPAFEGLPAVAHARKATQRLRSLLPLMVHLAAIRLPESGAGDPLEPLVGATKEWLHGGMRLRAAPMIYRAADEGRLLILLDGFDETPHESRYAVAHWIRELSLLYSSSVILVTAGTDGYQPLADANVGLAYLRAWSAEDRRTHRSHLMAITDARDGGPEDLPEAARTDLHPPGPAFLPLEQTLHSWAMLRPEAIAVRTAPGFLEGGDSFADFLRARSEAVADHWAFLASLGALSCDDAFHFTPERFTSSFNEHLSETTSVSADGPPPGTQAAEPPNEPERNAMAQALLSTLLNDGILRQYQADDVRFWHPLLAAYFASHQIAREAPRWTVRRAGLANWRTALAFANWHIDLTPVLLALLESPEFRATDALSLVPWLRYASPTAPWRDHLLRLLARQIGAPTQFSAVREQIAASLLSNAPDGAQVVFRYALRSRTPLNQRLAILALGALQDPDAEAAILQLASEAADHQVQIAAVAALGRYPDGAATLADLLVHTRSDVVRRMAAEELAQTPANRSVLEEAAGLSDVNARRASIQGLQRIGDRGALQRIHAAFLREDQWHAKAVAEEALGITPAPAPLSPDLRQPKTALGGWLALPEDASEDTSKGLLALARERLAYGESADKAALAQLLGSVGASDSLRLTIEALADSHASVRDAAYSGVELAATRLRRVESDPAFRA